MPFLRRSLLVFAALWFGAVPAAAEGGASASVQSAAPIALVEDFESGAVLYEKNADQPMGPAQMVQLMTADVVFNELHAGRLHLGDSLTVSEYAWRTGGGHGHSTSMFLDVKSRVGVEDLLRGLIIQSGNDAAIVFAEAVSGSEGAFAQVMNKRADEIGLAHSTFVNPYGKPDPQQRTTARDLATLAAHIIRNYPDEYRYFSEKDFTWNKIHQLNRNPLLTLSLGADGLKGGDSTESGYGLVGSAVQNGQRLIVVVNGLKTASERAEEARKLFNFGFGAFDPRVLFEPGETIGTASVYGGATGRVELTSPTPVKIFVPRGSTDRLLARIVYSGPLVAPIEANVEAARLKVWRGATLALDVPLRTKSAVAVGTLSQRALDASLELAGGWIRRLLAKK